MGPPRNFIGTGLPSQAPHFYPTGGFNPLFEKAEGFEVRYGMQVHHVEIVGKRPQVVTNSSSMSADLIIVPAPIDAVFGAPCLIAIEACASSHHWSRQLRDWDTTCG
jgi:hypothetical protein